MTRLTRILSVVLFGTVLAIGLRFALNALWLYHPPQLATFRWKCDLTRCDLYDGGGDNVATVMSRLGSGYSVHIWNKDSGMSDWGDFETKQKAFEFVAMEESKAQNQPQKVHSKGRDWEDCKALAGPEGLQCRILPNGRDIEVRSVVSTNPACSVGSEFVPYPPQINGCGVHVPSSRPKMPPIHR